MTRWIHVNGQTVAANTKIVTAGNRGLRYGDGLFETMRVMEGAVLLASYHFDRLFQGLTTLHIPVPEFLTPAYLSEQIIELCRRNDVEKAARVRLNIFRGAGTLTKMEEATPYIVIECEPLLESYLHWNEKGLITDVFPDAQKSVDKFANLKSNNYLPYLMGALYAKEKGLDDCLLLNTHQRICDATIANVFIIKDNLITTPPLFEGCVAGVMRRYLLSQLPEAGYNLQEKPITSEDLEQADEICLTNALFGVRWVQQFGQKKYTNEIAAEIYKRFIKIEQPSKLL